MIPDDTMHATHDDLLQLTSRRIESLRPVLNLLTHVIQTAANNPNLDRQLTMNLVRVLTQEAAELTRDLDVSLRGPWTFPYDSEGGEI
jgi:hypothetical protein